MARGWKRVSALAGGLRGLGVIGTRPLLILARNGIDHAMIKYAAMSQGMPVAPVSPQYGLPGANLTRLAHAVEVLNPAAVYTEDADLFRTPSMRPSSQVCPSLPERAPVRGRSLPGLTQGQPGRRHGAA